MEGASPEMFLFVNRAQTEGASRSGFTPTKKRLGRLGHSHSDPDWIPVNAPGFQNVPITAPISFSAVNNPGY